MNAVFRENVETAATFHFRNTAVNRNIKGGRICMLLFARGRVTMPIQSQYSKVSVI